ncbi:MAG: FIST C-terminal domain-containing protein [Bacteroidota bacterium]
MPYCPPKIEEIVSTALQLAGEDQHTCMIFLAENDMPDVGQLMSALNEKGIRFFGGIFPGIIFDTDKKNEGAVLFSIPSTASIHLVTGLEQDNFDLGHLPVPQTSHKETALILVDGLTAHIADFLIQLHNLFGHKVDFFGGGAGSLSLQQMPCLFDNKGIYQDAALVAFIPSEIKLGVRHGWKKIMGPLIATKTHKNIIVELNWQNAFEVYKEVVEADSKEKFNGDNFFDIAKGYPFGIYKEGEEDIVRDPITVNDKGELTCVGEVPENTVLNILKGEPENLIHSAALATSDSLAQLQGKKATPILIDCISRVLFLEDRFSEELQAMKDSLTHLEGEIPQGALTLGEISSYGEGFVDFFNKTFVLGLLEKQV